MFVLGIGKGVDPAELNQIASGPENVFTVDSFEDLDEKANEIKRGICVLRILSSSTPSPTPAAVPTTLPTPAPTAVPATSPAPRRK